MTAETADVAELAPVDLVEVPADPAEVVGPPDCPGHDAADEEA